jgi:Flp pilus assembly protein TadG
MFTSDLSSGVPTRNGELHEPPESKAMITKIKSHNGQVIIEFALILPLMLLLLGGIVDFGILLYNKQVIDNASREGARAGIVHLLNSNGGKVPVDIQGTVANYCENRLVTFGEGAAPVTTFSPEDLLAASYPDDLTVTVSYQYTFLFSSVLNMFGGNFGPTLNLTSQTVMKME